MRSAAVPIREAFVDTSAISVTPTRSGFGTLIRVRKFSPNQPGFAKQLTIMEEGFAKRQVDQLMEDTQEAKPADGKVAFYLNNSDRMKNERELFDTDVTTT